MSCPRPSWQRWAGASTRTCRRQIGCRMVESAPRVTAQAPSEQAAITPMYVIGHLNPDTDAIAAAMGYAWLLRERDGLNAIAARAGGVNAQTAWVLKIAGLEAPRLITDASPRFERI